MLFQFQPDDDGWATEGESFGDYYRRSTRPEVRAVVATLEEWFTNYPQRHRDGMRARFSDKDERDQYAAFWELYLHESLRRSGADIHVVAPVQGTPTPDFYLEHCGRRFYVEAVVAGPFGGEFSAQRRETAFRAELNKIDCGRWMLGLTILSPGRDTPPTRRIRRAVEAWLQTLDYDAEVKATAEPGYSFQARAFETADWAFEIQAWPGRKSQRERKNTDAIRVYGGGVKLVENHVAIRNEVRQKAKKYDLNAPLLVAVLARRDFADEEQVMEALFGSDQVQYTIDPEKMTIAAAKEVRARDGVWSDPNRESAKHLGGVIVALNLGPPNIVSHRPNVWANPFVSRQPVALPESLPWGARWIGADRKLARNDRSDDLFGYYGLPDRWPHSP